jgi:Uma2 family endonuclease
MNARAHVTEAAPHRFTVDDVRAMMDAGIIDPDSRFELIDGEIIDTPSEGAPHMSAKNAMNLWFARRVYDEPRRCTRAAW